MSKLPAFMFYPGDWMKDPNLRRCSQAARGVWIDMLCLMFECEQRGVLITGSSPWSREDAAAAVGGNADVTLRCIDELVAKGVCKVREDGALYSKRLLDDETNRVNTRERVAKFRQKQECNAPSNAPVTALKHRSSYSVTVSSTDNKDSSPDESGPAAKSRKGKVCDEEWLAGIASSDTYAEINVRQEFGKMQAWCAANRRIPSQRRFINWLNRCEKPMRPLQELPRLGVNVV